jgi:putative N-acetyltransferase (TIGR04045 family)
MTTQIQHEIDCRVATELGDAVAHFAVRHLVFVEEQHLFEGSDRDARDADPATLHVVGRVDAVACGAVRLYPQDQDGAIWRGDRLAVLPEYRRFGVGAPLVRFAVRTAGQVGGRAMVARIQLPNVVFFQKLGWRRHGPVESYVGVGHQPMIIDLGG